MRRSVCILALVGVLVLTLPVHALTTYSFDIFTDNGNWGTTGNNFDDPLLRLSVDVYNGANTVSFKFKNDSDALLAGVTITDIYFDENIAVLKHLDNL